MDFGDNIEDNNNEVWLEAATHRLLFEAVMTALQLLFTEDHLLKILLQVANFLSQRPSDGIVHDLKTAIRIIRGNFLASGDLQNLFDMLTSYMSPSEGTAIKAMLLVISYEVKTFTEAL